MGVARPESALAALAWCALTLLSAWGPPLPPVALLGLLALALLIVAAAPRLPAASLTVLLAIGALPLWLSAAGVVGGMAPSFAVQVGCAAMSLVLLGLGLRSSEGRPLRLALLTGGLLLSLRALLAPGVPVGSLEVACGLGLALALAAASLGLPTGAVRPASLALTLATSLRLVGMADLVQAPSTPQDLLRARSAGLLAHHAPALAQDSALGLEALRLDPTNRVLALALLQRREPDELLDAGWRPEGATLSAAHRRAIGLSLERRGRGGEALRLLWAGRADPQVAWTFSLLQRDQGHEPTVLSPQRAPDEIPRLPGRLDLHWALLTEATRSWDLELDEPVQEIQVEGRAEACEGPAELELRIGDRVEQLRLPEATGALRLLWPLSAGPQRLHLAFRQDLITEACDRNVWVESITLR